MNIEEAIKIAKSITEDDLLNYWEGPEEPYNAIQTILNLIEKQSKEIEELKREKAIYYYEWKHLEANVINKIKAKVIEIKNRPVKDEFITATHEKLNTIIDIESLLDEEE